MRDSPAPINHLDYIGIALGSVGMIFEAGGDYQLARFKADAASKGQVLDSGLWRCFRHPNYILGAKYLYSPAKASITFGSYRPELNNYLFLVG